MKKEQGFSAIELLVTLFVAGIFLISGYQLFSMVTKDGGEARRQSIAYNEARKYLEYYKDTVSAGACAASNTNFPISVTGLTDASLIVNITCPYVSAPNLSKIVVTITYGSPQISVQDSTYAMR